MASTPLTPRLPGPGQEAVPWLTIHSRATISAFVESRWASCGCPATSTAPRARPGGSALQVIHGGAAPSLGELPVPHPFLPTDTSTLCPAADLGSAGGPAQRLSQDSPAPAPPGETMVAPLSLEAQRSPHLLSHPGCGVSALCFVCMGAKCPAGPQASAAESHPPGLRGLCSPPVSSRAEEKLAFVTSWQGRGFPAAGAGDSPSPNPKHPDSIKNGCLQTTSAAMPGVHEDAHVYLWICLCSCPLQSRNKAKLPLQYTASGAHIREIY